MRLIFEGKTPYFTTKIMQGSEKYPGALPVVNKEFMPITSTSGYFGKKILDTNRRYGRTLQEAFESAEAFVNDFNTRVKQFDDLLTDYDKDEVLPSTSALGYWKTSHTDFEALGFLGMATDFEYPKNLEDAVVAFYKRHLVAEDDKIKRMSLPRGKNIGYPYPISGRQRDLSDLLLALSVALPYGVEKDGGHRLSDIYSFLSKFHGDPFTVNGERYQHNAKEQPLIVQDGIYSSTNFEARTRIICMSPKVSIAKMRRPVKRLLYTLMKSPVHVQDRSVIKTRINKMLSSYSSVFAIDASKFDFRFGGKRGKQILRILSRIIDDPRFLEDALLDFDTKIVVFGYRKAYEGRGDLMLKSGMGTTTLIGCVGSFISAVFVVADLLKRDFSATINSYGTDWDMLAWGDDVVLGLKQKTDIKQVNASYVKAKMEVEAESNIKFLGYSYAKGSYQGSMDIGYSVGRAIQQQFYPERPKLYPFSTVGYIARLELMGPKGQMFHERMLKIWDAEHLGPPFTYKEKGDVILKLIPEIQKQSEKMAAIDDVLNIFTHGISDIDPELIDISDEMSELLGTLAVVDLTDPVKFLKENNVPSNFVDLTARLAKGDLSVYNLLMYEMQRHYNLQYKPGSVLY